MAKYFSYNKPPFNFNIHNIKADVSVVSIKYKPTQHSRFQPPTRQDGYYYYEDAISTLNNDTGKLVMLIRHAERYQSSDISTEITPDGKARAQEFGQGMEAQFNNVLDRTYLEGYGTEYFRTKQTVAHIFNGANPSVIPYPDQYAQGDNIENFTDIHGSLYVNYTSWDKISEYCSKDYWPDISNKSKILINNIFNHIENKPERFHIMVSHDQLLAPFIYYASNQTILITSNNWVRYLSGVLLFLYNDNTYEIVPIMGTDYNY